ncbi:hypothetical protein ABCS02_07965 [Microbacterium sp. X-17]
MSAASDAPAPAPRPTLAVLGDPAAAACDGDACVLPGGVQDRGPDTP